MVPALSVPVCSSTPHGETRILLLGLPGSGKSTQAQILSLQLGLPVVHPSDARTALGPDAPPWSDEDFAEAARERLAGMGGLASWIVDGYPRNLAQAERYWPDATLVLHLHVPERIAVKRVVRRARSRDAHIDLDRRMSREHLALYPVLVYARTKCRCIRIDGTLLDTAVARLIETACAD